MDKRNEELSLGQFLKELRKGKAKSLNDVERDINISKSYLSKLESDTKDNPSLYTIAKLAKYFKVPLGIFENFCDCKTYSYPESENIRDISELVMLEEYLFANIEVDMEFKLLFKNFIIYMEELTLKNAGRAEEAKLLDLLDDIRYKQLRLKESQEKRRE